MLRIGQLKLSPNHTEKELIQKIAKTLHINEKDIIQFNIKKQSIDARKKPDLFFVYTVDVEVIDEQRVLKRQKNGSVSVVKETPYTFTTSGTRKMSQRPMIIGSGPAGLFCAYMLAKYGYRPIVFERGADVDERIKNVDEFWNAGILNEKSNVQFGEGGAGTFSDGKLNTLVKDIMGRGKKVLEIFVENGAPEDILYINKPHIGTDVLTNVVRNMRKQIISWGGEVHFHSCFSDFTLNNGILSSITIETPKETVKYAAQTLVLAIGHSARDTFSMLYKKNIPITSKAFAVGVRVEHKQKMINDSQYGINSPYNLPAAAYKVSTTLENGRGVYSFCMCPGGYVVNASSEEGHLAVNGMSYHARDGQNANSAIIVTVTPDDFGTEHPLSGMYFQRDLEKKAYMLGNGKVPVQRFADFCANQPSTHVGCVIPQIKGEYVLSNVRDIFPKHISQCIESGIKSFDRQINGFANDDTILSGVESRTSSPIRIVRNDQFEIENTGIFPCGEGAGYAGGITSAAIDGMKIAENIAKIFTPFDSK